MIQTQDALTTRGGETLWLRVWQSEAPVHAAVLLVHLRRHAPASSAGGSRSRARLAWLAVRLEGPGCHVVP